MSEDFFEEQLPGSKIKSLIVSSYFRQWAKIIGKYSKELGYLDFFSGPGKYEDGTDSTPLLIIKSIISDTGLSASVKTFFNDIDQKNVEILEKEISALENIKSLKFYPNTTNVTVGDQVVKQMQSVELIPSLVFIDPWGYKGLSLELIASVIKDWGCDCIFFFNYNRINAALTNPFMKDHVNSIFGTVVAEKLREAVKGLSTQEREKLILDEFMNSLKKIKGKYSISFKFYKEDIKKTSHFLILVTKNPLGYHIMKEIMASNSDTNDGVPTYEYNPLKKNDPIQGNLFVAVRRPMDLLCEELCQAFSGKKMTVEEIYQQHNIGKPYIKSNYKSALLRLEQQDMIITEPSKDKRRVVLGKLTMADKIQITFK
jgi:three-Cys-motif partner protein